MARARLASRSGLWPARLALALALGVMPAASADTVTLTNGNQIVGVISQETATQITVDTAGGRMTIPRSRIQSIEAGAAWESWMQRAEDLRHRARWGEALEAYRMALDLMDEAGEAGDSEVRVTAERAVSECEGQIEAASALVFRDLLAEVESLVEAGRHQAAITLLEGAIADAQADQPVEILRQREAEVYLALARRQSDMTETMNAMQSLRRALELDPELAEAHLLLGQFLAQRDPASGDAIASLRQALDLFGEETGPEVVNEARYRLALCLEAARQRLEASEQFAQVHAAAGREYPRALSKAVDNILAWVNAQPMMTAVTSGAVSGETAASAASAEPSPSAGGEAMAELIRMLNRAHDLDGTRIEPLNLLGDLYNYLGRSGEALDHYRRSLAIQNAQPLIHLRMGEMYAAMPGTEAQMQAEQALRSAVQYDPNLYPAHCALGEVYERRGQIEAATAEVEAALAINSNFARAYVIRGRLRRAQEDNEGAKADFLAAIQRSGNTLQPRLEMGRILAEENQLDEARTYFDQVLELVEAGDIPPGVDPDNVRSQCHVGIGRLMLRRNQTNQARDAITRATELDPAYSDAFTALGEVYVALEQYPDAEQAYQRAISLNPGEPNNYFLLGQLYKEYFPGRDQDAIANFRLYIENNGTDVEAIRQLLAELGTTL